MEYPTIRTALVGAAFALAMAFHGPAWAQDEDLDTGLDEMITEEGAPPAEAMPAEDAAGAPEGEPEVGAVEEAPVTGEPDVGAMDETATVEPDMETAPPGGSITISPEMQKVLKLQGDIHDQTAEKPGDNMRARMGAGSDVPMAVIGEGASEAPQVYIVKLGDTLWDISARFLTDPFLWPRIHEANPQIINADLIYPGEPITIYPRDFNQATTRIVTLLPPQELQIETEEAPTTEPVIAGPVVEPIKEELIDELEPEPERVEDAKKWIEQITKIEKVQVLSEEATELISKKREVRTRRSRNVLEYPRADAAGWLEFLDGSELEKAGYILGQEDPKARIRAAPGDKIFINRGKINGVAAGDRYLIFRIGDEVEHPVTGDYLGNQIKPLGHLQVEAVYERTSAARIIEAYEDVSSGDKAFEGIADYDRVIPEIEFQKEIRFTPNDQDIEGYIVANRESTLSMSPHDVVYIDKGTNDGVSVGNIFRIYRPNRAVEDPEVGDDVQLPRFYVGEMVVIQTREKTSTALVMAARREIVIGDQVSIAPFDLEPEETQEAKVSAAAK